MDKGGLHPAGLEVLGLVGTEKLVVLLRLVEADYIVDGGHVHTRVLVDGPVAIL